MDEEVRNWMKRKMENINAGKPVLGGHAPFGPLPLLRKISLFKKFGPKEPKVQVEIEMPAEEDIKEPETNKPEAKKKPTNEEAVAEHKAEPMEQPITTAVDIEGNIARDVKANIASEMAERTEAEQHPQVEQQPKPRRFKLPKLRLPKISLPKVSKAQKPMSLPKQKTSKPSSGPPRPIIGIFTKKRILVAIISSIAGILVGYLVLQLIK